MKRPKRRGPDRTTRFHYVTCADCNKRGYLNRDAAKAARRGLHDPRLHIYPCPAGSGLLHLGHQAPGQTRQTYVLRHEQATS